MAPVSIGQPPVVSGSGDIHQPKKTSINPNVFPDGLKTSGQHPPIYSNLYPYCTFPKEITGPTLWSSTEYSSHPESWTHILTPSEISALGTAADAFLSSSAPLTSISSTNFLLPTLAPTLSSIRRELLNGKGFILFKNFPVCAWPPHKVATAYLGLGTHLGYPVSQNGRGHIMGHVKDLGEDAQQTDKVRIYRTNARQFFHTDEADIVGLLCIARAAEGGESDIVSNHAVWNALQAERPDVAERLTQPVWYVDRKGEVSEGEEPWIKTSIFQLEPPSSDDPLASPGRLYCKWDPYHIRSLTRFSSQGLIPPLSPEQDEAARVLEATCERLKLHMVLEVGDVQFLSNNHVLHARTAYTDHAPGSGLPRRHLMRLWLATPQGESGWRTAFADSGEKKRGGIQVGLQKPVANLDAD